MRLRLSPKMPATEGPGDCEAVTLRGATPGPPPARLSPGKLKSPRQSTSSPRRPGGGATTPGSGPSTGAAAAEAARLRRTQARSRSRTASGTGLRVSGRHRPTCRARATPSHPVEILNGAHASGNAVRKVRTIILWTLAVENGYALQQVGGLELVIEGTNVTSPARHHRCRSSTAARAPRTPAGRSSSSSVEGQRPLFGWTPGASAAGGFDDQNLAVYLLKPVAASVRGTPG